LTQDSLSSLHTKLSRLSELVDEFQLQRKFLF